MISVSLKSLEKTELKSASTLITCHDIKKDLATTYDVATHKKLPLTRSVVVQGSGFPVDKRYLYPREEEAVGGGTAVVHTYTALLTGMLFTTSEGKRVFLRLGSSDFFCKFTFEKQD